MINNIKDIFIKIRKAIIALSIIALFNLYFAPSTNASTTVNVTSVPCIASYPIIPFTTLCPGPCALSFEANFSAALILPAFDIAIKELNNQLIELMASRIDDIVDDQFDFLNQMEIATDSFRITDSGPGIFNGNELALDVLGNDWLRLSLADWWRLWYWYDYRPSMEDMTNQLNAATIDQARQLGSFLDASNSVNRMMEHNRMQVEAHHRFKSSELVCVRGTKSAGIGRARNFVRQMKKAWDREDNLEAMVSTGSGVHEDGPLAVIGEYADDYENIFCDPNGNGGLGACASTIPELYDADVEFANTLQTKPTLNNIQTAEYRVAVERLNENIMGIDGFNEFPASALTGQAGQQKFLQKRAFLAKKSAAKAVLNHITAQRVPGSQLDDWAEEVRLAAGIDAINISDNPSYKEVTRAVAKEMFNRRYASNLIDVPENTEKESVVLSAFYLMMLRDYYELLERVALNLSVQVTLMVDQMPENSNRAN